MIFYYLVHCYYKRVSIFGKGNLLELESCLLLPKYIINIHEEIRGEFKCKLKDGFQFKLKKIDGFQQI